ncbi:sugar phosphate isomerase/epimerase family protein [Planctomicrobium piriforme]|uniref:Sugar phosphate isomerase/epimerase n=1 Tax=Planctomicrobium piriforme TaxID=1576369 RepID=A0A1I3FC15_9PLAN|nr:TIM barrel protein [Planctomicrobium piriforme]SFI08692.1 Sugar phosphate isomerase/epimerase [Planctomicrobium piriforme]
MPHHPTIFLSAFADEAANRKTAIEQLAVLAALGLKYYSPRFVDVTGAGKVKHVVELDEAELAQLASLQTEYGMSVTSIGSRLGKIKLLDKEDGSHNKFVPFDEYMQGEVASTIRAAKALDAKLIRGFSFYQPKGDAPEKYVDQAVPLIGKIADEFAKHGIVYGLEVEANLIGQNGRMLAELAKKLNRDNLVVIFDGGNLSSQNMDPVQCFKEYEAMRPYIGWIHIKDYAIDSSLEWKGYVDEERLKNFVPANVGDSGHELILRDFRDHIPAATARMQKFGLPGTFLELEPHLKGGGQFGGFSGPDGMGVAVRALCSVLDYVGIDYDLRTMCDIKKARGF